jgi:hypothetical protein
MCSPSPLWFRKRVASRERKRWQDAEAGIEPPRAATSPPRRGRWRRERNLDSQPARGITDRTRRANGRFRRSARPPGCAGPSRARTPQCQASPGSDPNAATRREASLGSSAGTARRPGLEVAILPPESRTPTTARPRVREVGLVQAPLSVSVAPSGSTNANPRPSWARTISPATLARLRCR